MSGLDGDIAKAFHFKYKDVMKLVSSSEKGSEYYIYNEETCLWEQMRSKELLIGHVLEFSEYFEEKMREEFGECEDPKEIKKSIKACKSEMKEINKKFNKNPSGELGAQSNEKTSLLLELTNNLDK